MEIILLFTRTKFGSSVNGMLSTEGRSACLTDLLVALKEKEDEFTRMEGSSVTEYEDALSTPSIEARVCPKVFYSHQRLMTPLAYGRELSN